MADLSNWAFPPEMQPNAEELRFDLEAALDSMVLVRSEVPEDAFTAGILGTERAGNGVDIRGDGHVLISVGGRLGGIGSLMVQEELGGRTVQGNMTVPIDLLEPILEDLVKLGRARRPARPWLGLYATEVKGHVVVSGLAGGGPAERAGVQVGDIVMEVASVRVSGLADLFRKIWSTGSAGVEVPMTLLREGARA